MLLFGLWGIATACVFWSAMIKATVTGASSAEQGRAFGILEGGRKFVDMASAALLLAIFAFRGGDDAAPLRNYPDSCRIHSGFGSSRLDSHERC